MIIDAANTVKRKKKKPTIDLIYNTAKKNYECDVSYEDFRSRFNELVDRGILVNKKPMVDRGILVNKKPMVDRGILVNKKPMDENGSYYVCMKNSQFPITIPLWTR